MFTATPLAGNPLAVVHDADGLDEGTMLAFARETRLSETTFVQRPGAPEASYRNRIWMTVGEIPFAGHPSLGTAVAVADRRGEREAEYVQETGAGVQPVSVRLGDGAARASMLQQPPEHGPEADPGRALAAAGLAPDAADPRWAPQVVSTGIAHLIAPVARGALDAVRPDAAALRGLLEPLGAACLYLAACDPDGEAARARSLFVDEAGRAVEDPATGSAGGPLLAYLRERTGAERLEVDQGVEMGRASRLSCAWEGDRPRVGGDVVIVARGEVDLPHPTVVQP